MITIQRILVPIDMSEVSWTALPYALGIASRYGAAVLLLHVVEDAFPYPDLYAWSNPEKDFFKEMRKIALEKMDEGIGRQEAGDAKVERLVVRGRPAAEILRIAEQKGADLIVLSSHGRTGMDHAIFGSQSERVLHGAACPVLVVKAGKKPKAERAERKTKKR